MAQRNLSTKQSGAPIAFGCSRVEHEVSMFNGGESQKARVEREEGFSLIHSRGTLPDYPGANACQTWLVCRRFD